MSIRGLEPANNCSICNIEYDEEEGGVQGYFGILPVTFCAFCHAALVDMVLGEYDYEGDGNDEIRH